jgi:hypothetical protein
MVPFKGPRLPKIEGLWVFFSVIEPTIPNPTSFGLLSESKRNFLDDWTCKSPVSFLLESPVLKALKFL